MTTNLLGLAVGTRKISFSDYDNIDDFSCKELWLGVLCLQNRQIPKHKKHNDGWNKQYVLHNNFQSMVAIMVKIK